MQPILDYIVVQIWSQCQAGYVFSMPRCHLAATYSTNASRGLSLRDRHLYVSASTGWGIKRWSPLSLCQWRRKQFASGWAQCVAPAENFL